MPLVVLQKRSARGEGRGATQEPEGHPMCAGIRPRRRCTCRCRCRAHGPRGGAARRRWPCTRRRGPRPGADAGGRGRSGRHAAAVRVPRRGVLWSRAAQVDAFFCFCLPFPPPSRFASGVCAPAWPIDLGLRWNRTTCEMGPILSLSCKLGCG
jgi:hypothetical protein